MFPKIVKHPQIIHFDRAFHYKPSILGYHYFWTHISTRYSYLVDFLEIQSKPMGSGGMRKKKTSLTEPTGNAKSMRLANSNQTSLVLNTYIIYHITNIRVHIYIRYLHPLFQIYFLHGTFSCKQLGLESCNLVPNKILPGWNCPYRWWKKSRVHQLRLVVYPIIFTGFCTSQVVIARFLPSTVWTVVN